MGTTDPRHPLLDLDRLIPEGWQKSLVFRSVYLVYLGRDGVLPKLFDHFGKVCHEFALDKTPWLEGVTAEELLRRELHGLREDIDHATGYLAHLAAQLAESPHHPGETLLAPKLATVAQKLREASDVLQALVPEEELAADEA